jgi:pyrimidine operon attenuation protein/uracil phosphoribosyltransferase
MKKKILDGKQLQQKIKRIAYQVLEHNLNEDQIIIAGIADRGYIFAEKLFDELKQICDANIDLIEISLDKASLLQSEIKLNQDTEFLRNKVIILVDDVLNTGRTLAYSLKPFLNIEVKKIQTAILVDRNYKSFPISADYVGYLMSTTLQEHVSVQFEEDGEAGVFIE